MNINLIDYVLPSNKQNLSIYDHLDDLFIDQWSTEMNYSKYLDNCNPPLCTYTTTDQINLSYAIALFVSFYGGLIIILRLIAPFLVNILLKLKYHSNNTNHDSYVRHFFQWIKRLNLFKVANERTENHIREQKMITRVYLILLISMTICIAHISLFVSFLFL